jgi:ubiquinone/menaquinone biosynthesis C-methylase UbiE
MNAAEIEFNLFQGVISPYFDIRNKMILDLCCQFGVHMPFMEAAGANVIGADIINYKGNEHLHQFIRSDAQLLSLKNACIDIVFCINAFEHIKNPKAALAEIKRVLKPNGYAFISFCPCFNSDVGSHFFDKVPEPWAHLMPGYLDKLRAATSSTEYFTNELINGLNKLPASYFINLFNNTNMKILKKVEWRGTDYPRHPNFDLLKKAVPEEELLFRGMCILLQA